VTTFFVAKTSHTGKIYVMADNNPQFTSSPWQWLQKNIIEPFKYQTSAQGANDYYNEAGNGIKSRIDPDKAAAFASYFNGTSPKYKKED